MSRRCGDRGHFGRRGVILPLALLVIAFLAVLAAQVVFRSSAELAAASATKAALQARLAAEAGIQKAILMLRENRSDIDAWYDNADAFRAQIVNSDELGSTGGLVESEPKQVSPENKPIWRFSVVADDPTSDGLACRYGLIDEASKLNINVASKEQLATLISLVVTDRQVNVSELVDAIIDWRDSDDEPEPDVQTLTDEAGQPVVALGNPVVEPCLETVDAVGDEAEHADLVDAARQVCGQRHLGEQTRAPAVASLFKELPRRHIRGPEARDRSKNGRGRPASGLEEGHRQPLRRTTQ